MVALEFNWLYFTLVVFISGLIPGLALGWPLLKKSDLSKLEKLIFCLFIGLVVPPSMLVLEDMAGIKFSLFLVFINMFLVIAAGVLWGIKQGAFSFKLPAFSIDNSLSLEATYRHLPTIILIIAMLLSFWIRLQSFSPVYSELDPYFYVYGTGQIIREGEVPRLEDTAWWPEVKNAGHRTFPSLKMYIEAQWYALYTGGGEYNNYLLFDTASWLPPILAAFMAFGAYLIFSSYYGKRYGLLAAMLFTFLPITIFKMSAGVNEASPEGMAAIFLVLGAYALALKKNDLRLGAIAALTFFVAVASSNYEPVISIPVAGFIVLQAIDYYARGKKHHGFLEITALLVAGLLAGSFVDTVYPTDIWSLPSMLLNPLLIMCVGALALAFALERIEPLTKIVEKKRQVLVAAAAILCLLVLLIPNPIGKIAKAEIRAYVGNADFNFPLQRTIAEQNQAGTSFEGESGFLALIPKNRIVQATGIFQNISNIAFGLLDALAAVFTAIGNAVLQLASAVSNALLGTNITTDKKEDSLLFFFLIAGTLGMVWNHFARHGDERNLPSIAILLLLLILPITFVGLNKIKYTIFVGITLVVAAVATIAELERAALWIAKKLKGSPGAIDSARKVFLALIVVMVAGQIMLPSAFSMMILSKSFEPRYQDDPAAAMPRLADMCEELRAKGYYDQEICAAGYNITFADTINSQFNSKVCLVSQLSVAEIFPGQSAAEQTASQEAKAGASFRCNRLADYWVNSMEWIRNNVAPEDRVTSWWDYGHWINYFGDRKTVLRNEHASTGMIGRVAHDYILGTPQDLINSMNYFDSRYVLFDVELIGGSSFGGKYGALDYLGCAHEGETSVRQSPGTSKCELDHSPERIGVLKQAAACTISESQQRAGMLAYPFTLNGIDQAHPIYCVGEMAIGNGQKTNVTYYLDRKDANGDLTLNKGFMRQIDDSPQAAVYEMVYNNQQVWPGPNGTLVDGMEDAKTKFYTSNLYAGVYLEKIPGFDLVYKSTNGEVKIYKMQNFTGNKAGWVDPAYINKVQ